MQMHGFDIFVCSQSQWSFFYQTLFFYSERIMVGGIAIIELWPATSCNELLKGQSNFRRSNINKLSSNLSFG